MDLKTLVTVYVFAALHAVCTRFEWEGLFWAGVTINLSNTNHFFPPASEFKESPAALLSVFPR